MNKFTCSTCGKTISAIATEAHCTQDKCRVRKYGRSWPAPMTCVDYDALDQATRSTAYELVA